jgi:hypothetical protein
VDKSQKRLNVIETQLSSSLSPAQIYPTYFFSVFGMAFQFNGTYKDIPRNFIANCPLYFNAFVSLADANDGDEYSISFPLASGSYYIHLSYTKSSTCGKLDTYIDGALVASGLDTYAAASDYQNDFTQAITLTGDGTHTVMFKVNGKNGSASDYRMAASYLEVMLA